MAKIKLFVLMAFYRILGSERATRVQVFFDALFHCREFYDEVMESREQFYSTCCHFCNSPHPTDANFCPECGEKIRSEEELAALWSEEAERAWEEYRQEQPQGPFEEVLVFDSTQEEELYEDWEIFEADEVHEVWYTEPPCGHRGYE